MALSVGKLNPAEFIQWDKFVFASPNGSIYNTSEYVEILCAATAGSFEIVAVKKGDHIQAGVLLYECNGRYGKTVSNRSLLYYNGIVAESLEPDEKVMSMLADYLDQLKFQSLTLNTETPLVDFRAFMTKGFTVSPSYSLEVPLTDLDILWKSIDKNLRRLIRKSQEAGLKFTQDLDFESFFRLHLELHERKAAPIYLPHDAFKNYFHALSQRNLCRLYHARGEDGESLVAALVLTGAFSKTHTICVASGDKSLSLGASPFLRWNIFSDLHVNGGYHSNDLTDAALGPVTHFKSQLGSKLKVNMVIRKESSKIGPRRILARLLKRK